MIQELDPNEDDEYITGKFEYQFGRGINFQIDTKNVQELTDSLESHKYPLRETYKIVGIRLKICSMAIDKSSCKILTDTYFGFHRELKKTSKIIPLKGDC